MLARHWSLVALGLGLVGTATSGCSGKDVSMLQVQLAPAVESGRLGLALTARGASGALYRLRQAQFQVFPTSPSGTGSFAFLNTEDDPLATTLEATLDIGDYQILLFGGWFLEKVVDGEAVRVDARLVSSDVQDFSIAANTETKVQYRFETSGEIVEFGQGRLVVEIDVSEQGSEPPLPEFTLGEPLQLAGGLIDPSSNSIGLSAVLFAVASPQNASVEVTSDTGEACVRGSMGAVQNADFANQWGVAFGLAFTAPGGFEAQPWNLDGGNVAGFAFTVSGPEIMPGMRVAALPGGADPTLVNFCRVLNAVPGERIEVPLESLDRDCWNGVRDPLSTMSLSDVSWVLPADELGPHSFDLCVSDLRPLLREGAR